MTDLVGGCRVRKDCARLEAYGTVDELNSHLGLLVAAMSDETDINCIRECQAVLFAVGAVLATDEKGGGHTRQTVTAEDVGRVEHTIDQWSRDLPPWRGFVLPGGTEAAARAHVCRAVCRRAERNILTLAGEAEVAGEVLRYVNRLSDLLFVLAQRMNFLAGREEILWQKHRP